MSDKQASAPGVRPSESIAEDAPDHRRRTARQARHTARERLHVLVADDEALEDADLLCPKPLHDLGRKPSRPPHRDPKPGRRSGYKVWKTTFWKRRRALWADRNRQLRDIVDAD